jgi:hypothetical protein
MIQAIYDEMTLFHATSAALGIPVWIYYAGVPLYLRCSSSGASIAAR